MKERRHYILSAALFALFLALPTAASASGHSSCDHSGWTALTSDMSSITSSGNYYLAEDVALEETLSIRGNNSSIINICLNGHQLSLSDGVSGSVIFVQTNGVFNLYDCTGSEATGYNGMITGGTGALDGGNIQDVLYGGGVFFSGGSFNMYGGAIRNNNAQGGGGVYINAPVNTPDAFNMYGGIISSNTGSSGGGGVLIYQGTFNLHSGLICENISSNGAGVDNGVRGTFNMFGGQILRNELTNMGKGGGVCNSGIFNMKDGRICDNNTNVTFTKGGGVYIQGHTFNVYDGTISGNKAHNGGGIGIYTANGATLNMSGGSIVQNTATAAGGGVFCDQKEATVHVSGAPTIQNNTANSLPDNLYLPTGKTITVGTDLDGDGSTEYLTGGSIGVSTQTLPAPGAPVDVTGGNSANYKSFFTSDKSEYLVVNQGAGSSQVVQLSCDDITDFPLLEPAWCYTNSPILTFTNYEALQGATFKLYSRNADGTYTYEEEMTNAMVFLGADVFRLSRETLPESLPATLAVTATLDGKLESAYADFELRKDTAEGGSEDITEVLPPAEEDNTGNDDNDSDNGAGGSATDEKPHPLPAEVWVHGPVIREDGSIPPGLHIEKGDPNDPDYEDMRKDLLTGSNAGGMKLYKISLENAEVDVDRGKMTIRFYYGIEWAGHKVRVIHRKENGKNKGKKEKFDTYIDEQGFVSIEVDSFSPFLLALVEDAPAAPAPGPAAPGAASAAHGPSIGVPSAPSVQSSPVRLPTVLSPTADQHVTLSGGEAVLRIAASHASAYQWQADYGDGWQDIPGAVGSSYTATRAQAGALLRCRVTNAYGSVFSPLFRIAGEAVAEVPATGMAGHAAALFVLGGSALLIALLPPRRRRMGL